MLYKAVLHHIPLFMDGAWLLLVPLKTALDLQLLQTKYVVIQLAMSSSRRVSVVLTLTAVLPTYVVERSFCFGKFLVGCGRVVSRNGFEIKLSKCFKLISGLHTNFFAMMDTFAASFC